MITIIQEQKPDEKIVIGNFNDYKVKLGFSENLKYTKEKNQNDAEKLAEILGASVPASVAQGLLVIMIRKYYKGNKKVFKEVLEAFHGTD